MDNRFNTIAGWALAGGIAALGLSIVSSIAFKSERPEKMGYVIEGVETGGESGGAAVAPIATRLASGDLAKGESLFGQCVSCHSIAPGGPNLVGPNLYNTMGEPIGEGKAGFAFSSELKAVGGTWDFDKMDAWLASPRKFAPGTKMSFAGLSDPQARANVILFLNSKTDKPLPLPAPPAEEPAAGADEPAGNASDTLANQAELGAGAPSKDPQAQIEAEKKL